MATPVQYDDIVLGGGKAGKSLAMTLGTAGHKVALIERALIGGSCINVACIPTKTMVASAKHLHNAHHAMDFGLEISLPVLDSLKGVIARKRRVVKGMVDTHLDLFANTPNLEFFVGAGRFETANTIVVESTDGATHYLSSSRIYINSGSRTTVPEIPGLAETGYLTSTSVMELDKLPAHLLVVGGGYIALEFAQIFRRLGSKVTVVLRSNRFLPKEDADIAAAVQAILEGEGISFVFNAKVKQVFRADESNVRLAVTIDGKDEHINGSDILVAIGREANNQSLNLQAAGVETDNRGYIKVNEKLETNVPGIWAMGDCNGGPHFTHVSWDDYRIVRDNVLHNANRTTTGRLVPYTLFIDPELGRVGLTEDDARQKGLEFLIAKIPAQKIPRANTAGETKGVMKALIDKKTGLVLGCSILAHEGGEVMSVIQTAMLGKLPYTVLRDTIYTHPTMAESLNLLFAAVQ